MTYCVGICVDDGLVMIADTRTNAGLDNVSTYRKLRLFSVPGAKVIAVATAGNLSISQSVISLLEEGLPHPETGERERLIDAPSMFRAAQLVGRAIQTLNAELGAALARAHVAADVTFLLGGQVAGEDMRLFMVYAAGNFIECGPDTPFLQIGEHKYGKPILDRSITFGTGLHEALKLGLISMDSTLRSNIGVGLPLDLVTVRRGALTPETTRRVETDDPYFRDLSDRWSAALRAAHMAIPDPPYF
ncbi:putative proteasome-type protease [Pseudochelatococcus lubricantis]|uniref:Proteasome-type protease n=1 Tax=Pseudochelatococcus lubricantis TaxID=1538102 RepID=A0ABX0UZA4_9HYPH|nr:peptidase [Pseudochelatococcus lubricantis]NIJ58279.1 putative proteasome-type protease [Pseudochelatococcus lubricantis]